MKGNMNIYYDEEGDFLEINVGKLTKGYFKNIGEGIFERRNQKTNKITGIAIMGFKKRTKQSSHVNLHLPIKLELSA